MVQPEGYEVFDFGVNIGFVAAEGTGYEGAWVKRGMGYI
jgi:hypothetical protein